MCLSNPSLNVQPIEVVQATVRSIVRNLLACMLCHMTETYAYQFHAFLPCTGPACMGSTPNTIPNHGGSTMFVYTPQAVADFRAKVLVPFFKSYDPSVNTVALLKAVESLQSKQLDASLKMVSPLNKVPMYAINIKTASKQP